MITFLSGPTEVTLRKLKNVSNNLWDGNDFDFLAELYKAGPNRMQRIGESMDCMERQNNDRVQKTLKRKQRQLYTKDIMRKTAACRSRESESLSKKRQVDFAQTARIISDRGGEMFGGITFEERKKLQGGSPD